LGLVSHRVKKICAVGGGAKIVSGLVTAGTGGFAIADVIESVFELLAFTP